MLSLSEVIIGFAWSTLFSRTAGITNLLVLAGLMASRWPVAELRGGADRHGLPGVPLYGAGALSGAGASRPHAGEAARTLGASPVRAFFNVVVPALRNTVVATLIMVFVFALGSYLLPQMLGRPQHWTLSVLITDQAIYQSNMPFAAAMAVFLVLAVARAGGADGHVDRAQGGGGMTDVAASSFFAVGLFLARR